MDYKSNILEIGSKIKLEDALTVDKVSNYVGIGTTSPTTKLDVLGEVSISSNNHQLSINQLDGTLVGRLSYTGTTLRVQGNDGIQFMDTNNANIHAVITDAGNFGIGTTVFPTSSIGSKHLLVNGAIIAKPDNVNDYYSYIKSNWAANDAFEIGIQGAGTNHKLITTSDYYYGTVLNLWTSDTKRLTINSVGSIQFSAYDSTNNTGTPTYLLGTDASGNIVKTNTVPGSAAGPYLPLTGGTLTGDLTLSYAYPRINLTDTNNDSDYSIINNDGEFGIYDVTNNSYRFKIYPGGDASFSNSVYAQGFVSSNFVSTTQGFSIESGDSTVTTYRFDADKFRFYSGNYGEIFSLKENGNVGIGTTSPTLAKLEVRDSSTQPGLLITSDGGNEQFKIQRYSNNNEQLILGFHSSDYAQIQAVEQGVAYRTLALNPSGGNVGIGTPSPGAKLSLYNATEDVSINVNTGTGGSYPKKTGISFGATSTSLGGDAEFTGGAGIQAINTAASNNPTDLTFWTTAGGSPAERVRITSAGGISFGSTGTAYGTSGQILKSNANASPTWVDASTVIGGPYLPLSAGLSYPLTGDLFIEGASTPKITLTDTTNNLEGRIRVANNFMYIEADDSDTVASTVMLLKTDGVEALRLDGNQDATFAGTIAVQGTGDSYFQGDVGIGVTSPAGRLDIRKAQSTTAFTDPFLKLYPSSTTDTTGLTTITLGTSTADTYGVSLSGWRYGADGTPKFVLKMHNNSAAGIDALTVDHFGNVGIGTPSPSYALDIERQTGEVAIQLQARDDSSNTAIYFGDNSDADVGSLIYNQGSNYMSFTTNAGERMRIDSSGQAWFKSVTDYKIGLNDSAGVNQWWLKAYQSGAFAIHENGVEDKLTILAGGNVGIGTTNPSNKLTVESSDADTAIRIKSTNASGTARLIINAEGAGAGSTGDSVVFFDMNSTAWVAGVDKSDSSKFKIANDVYGDFRANNYFTVQTNGNVGIGTTNPLSKLVVSDDGGAGIEVQPQTSNDRTTLLSYDRNTNTYQTLDFDGSDMHFNVFGSERMRIDSSGNVGIGVTSIGSKLEVAGTINQTVLGGAPSDDLNNLDSTRFFKTHTATTNAPAAITSFGMGWTIAYAETQTVQFVTSRQASHPVYYRKQANGTYSSWIRLRDENQISDTDISNWDAAYTYSQVGHLPLTGGTLTGDLYLDDGDGATPSLYFKNGANNYWRYLMESGGDFSVKEGTSTRLTFQAGGNVGIGVTSPGKKLTVDADTTPYQGIKIQGANAPALTLFPTTGTATDNYIYALGSASFQGVIVISADNGDTGDNSGIRFRVDGDEYFSIEPGIIDAWNNRITNVANPIVGDDAANKSYVDNAVTGASTFRENKAFFTSWKINTTATSYLNVTAGGDQSSLGYDGLMVIPFDGKLEQVTVITDVTQAGFTFSLIDYTGAALWTSSSTTLTANSVTTFTPGTTITKSTHIMVGLKMVRGTQAVNNANINITVTYEWDT